MSLTSKEAAETLSDVERAAKRSAEAYGYSRSSPHLILWGAIWFLGYTGSDLYPAAAGWIWLVLVLIGCAAGTLIGHTQREAYVRRGWHMFGLIAIAFLFVFASYAVLKPTHDAQVAAYPPLIVGAIYAGLGLWLGLRFVVAGLLITALTLGGYFYLHEHFLLWMAVVGGGGLALAGLWFRKA